MFHGFYPIGMKTLGSSRTARLVSFIMCRDGLIQGVEGSPVRLGQQQGQEKKCICIWFAGEAECHFADGPIGWRNSPNVKRTVAQVF
jgi:hypothetical protein